MEATIPINIETNEIIAGGVELHFDMQVKKNKKLSLDKLIT